MALTEHVKRKTINVSLPDGHPNKVATEFYTDTEWDALQAERAATRLPRRKRRAKRIVREGSRSQLNAVLTQAEINRKQARMLELLELRIVNGTWTPEEQAERNALKAKLDEVKVICDKEDVAIAAIEAATTVQEVQAALDAWNA